MSIVVIYIVVIYSSLIAVLSTSYLSIMTGL